MEIIFINKSHMAKRDYIIDIARVVAILFIMLFHFYSLWDRIDAGEYPYGGNSYFKYGYLGVQFFFILAGYLIIPSLERSQTICSFWKKKLVRLGIPLVICTLITYIFCLLVDVDDFYPASHSLKNVLVSCIFIRPDLISPSLNYINGSTWFLWPLIQFFILSSLLWFLSRKYFNTLIISISLALPVFVYCVRRVVENYFLTNKFGIACSEETMLCIKDWMWTKEYTKYAHYFLFGISCYWFKNNRNILFLLLCGVCTLFPPLLRERFYGIIYIIMTLFLLYGVFGDKLNKSLSDLRLIRYFAKLGESTYAVFLLHETIGMVLIRRFAISWGMYAYLYPLMLIIMFFTIAYFG